MRFFGETKIDFIGKRRIAFIISIIIIAAGIVSLVINKGPKYSIDFTGGVSLELDLTPVNENGKIIEIQEIRDLLASEGIISTEIQEIKGMENRNFILIKTKELSETGEKVGNKIIETIKTAFPDNIDPEKLIRLQEEVGPKIGEELRGKAI
jgi:preprotein translocase subunit SecF